MPLDRPGAFPTGGCVDLQHHSPNIALAPETALEVDRPRRSESEDWISREAAGEVEDLGETKRAMTCPALAATILSREAIPATP